VARDPLIELSGVSKHFGGARGPLDVLLGRASSPVRALDGVDLRVGRGETLGVAGESGSGKTTLARLVAKLTEPTAGTVTFDGTDLADLSRADERAFRRRVQVVFQDPFESLDPRLTVAEAVAEPLRLTDDYADRAARRDRVRAVLADVGLAPASAYLDAFPGTLSGGERQRVAIARALAVDPDVLVCDEPTSMLDVSVRAAVLNLLRDLHERYALTVLFVSHDLSVVRYVCERTAVTYLGEVVEVGPTADLLSDPAHPYTRALVEAAPDSTVGARRHASITGETPTPRDPPAGCRLHPRCPAVVPPADWRGSQDAFRRALQFKRRVRSEDFAPPSTVGLAPRDVLERGLALDLPGDSTPSTVDERGERRVDPDAFEFGPAAREALDAAANAVSEGDRASALAALDGVVESVCERDPPVERRAGSRRVACHRYDDGDDWADGGDGDDGEAGGDDGDDEGNGDGDGDGEVDGAGDGGGGDGEPKTG